MLEHLPSDALKTLEARCRWHEYTANEQIFDQGSENRDIYFVVAGGVRIVNFSTTGREIAFANLGPGRYFGEMSAIDSQPRSAAVVATRDTMIASLSAEIFLDLMYERPTIAITVMRNLCATVRSCDDRIMDLSTLRAVQRVFVEMLRLAELAPSAAGSPVVDPLPNHSDIASLASTTRETVARVMSELASGGIVERQGRKLIVRDINKLRKLATQPGLDGDY